MIVGLTGHIGAGKSLAAAMLAELGAAVINADAVGHEVLLPGGAAYQPVLAAFGAQFANADGLIDRKRLGAFVFADADGERLRLLNSLTHPAIRDLIVQRVAELRGQGRALVVIEAALLLGSPLQELADEVWLVTAARDTLLCRVTQRDGCTLEQAAQRLDAQPGEAQLLAAADRVFTNDGDAEALREQLRRAFAQIGGA